MGRRLKLFIALILGLKICVLNRRQSEGLIRSTTFSMRAMYFFTHLPPTSEIHPDAGESRELPAATGVVVIIMIATLAFASLDRTGSAKVLNSCK